MDYLDVLEQQLVHRHQRIHNHLNMLELQMVLNLYLDRHYQFHKFHRRPYLALYYKHRRHQQL